MTIRFFITGSNLGCFDQALVALGLGTRVFVVFSQVNQMYGSFIEIMGQIL